MDSTQVNDLILQHWGIKGQKWGRRRFQNKDGSLTPEGRKRYGDNSESTDGYGKTPKLSRKQRKEQARKAVEEAKAREEAETVEQKRERLLKSSDASELYKNRDLLSTAEINERLNRIDTERRLAKAAEDAQPAKKTFTDKVDAALKVGRKINEVYEFTNTPVMKAVKKKLGLSKGDDDEKLMSFKEVYEKRNELPDNVLKRYAERYNNIDKTRQGAELDAREANNKPNNTKPNDSGNNSKPNNTKSNDTANNTNPNDSVSGATGVRVMKWKVKQAEKVSAKVANESISKAKSEVADALSKVPKNKDLQKAAAKEIVKEVKPELDEVISTLNEAMIKANQKRLDDYNKNNK